MIVTGPRPQNKAFMIGETMKCDSWFPCYPSDLISDTTRLRPHDFGAYWRLLCDYYQNGPLPDDDEDLRRISGVDPQDWARTKGKIMLFFQLSEDGKWHQKRADEVISQRIERLKTLQDVSAKGVKKRRELGQLPPEQQDEPEDEPMDEPAVQPKDEPSVNTTKTRTKTKSITTAIANSFKPDSLEKRDWSGQLLTQKMVEILGSDEIGKRPDWITRANSHPSRMERIMDAMHADLSIGHIIKNRGAYAEHLWKVAK